jgi:hypothetical protein
LKTDQWNEQWKNLCGFVNQIVREVTNNDLDLAIRVLDRHKKGREVVKVRQAILTRVRNEIWELHSTRSPFWEVKFSSTPPVGSWRPLGYLSIAKILGGDHSSWVKMASQLRVKHATS